MGKIITVFLWTFSIWAAEPTGKELVGEALYSKTIDLQTLEVKITEAERHLEQLRRLGGSFWGAGGVDQATEALSDLRDNRREVRRQLEELKAKFAGQKGLGKGSSVQPQFLNPRGDRLEDLQIWNLEAYRSGGGGGFLYRDYQSPSGILHLRMMESRPHFSVPAHVTCQGPFYLKSFRKYRKARQTQSGSFFQKGRLYEDKDLLNFKLKVGSETGACQVQFSVNGKRYGISLRPESQLLSPIGILPQQVKVCESYSAGPKSSDLAALVAEQQGHQMGCIHESPQFQIIEKPLDGLAEKVRVLLGRKMSEKEIRAYRPGDFLDVSKAPMLDGIFVSTLTFDYDLSGALILALLEHHAQKGAQVRILTSGVTTKGKELPPLRRLADRYPHFQFRLFKDTSNGKTQGFKTDLAQFHRVNHIKLFLTYSKTQPQWNQMMSGGRNIGDVYHFEELPDLSGSPELVQYGKEKKAVYYDDFEYQLWGTEVVRDMILQYYRFWSADSQPFFVTPSNFHVDPVSHFSAKKFQWDKVYVRNQMSYPSFDGGKGQESFVMAIDNSKTEIRLLTPYFNLTKKIAMALLNAVERGVDVQIVTNTNLQGDNFSDLLESVNIKTINRFYKKFQIWRYTDPVGILHAKIYLFDQDLAILGSPNLNQRSFFHDPENLTHIFSQAIVKDLSGHFNRYKAQSELVEQPVSVLPGDWSFTDFFTTEF